MIENVLISVLLASVKCPDQEESISHPAFRATSRLLVARVSLIYLVDELFIFSFLPSLNEIRT